MAKKCGTRLCISQSYATLFRHSAVLLHELPYYSYMTLHCELLAHTVSMVLFDKITLAIIVKLLLEITSITTLNGQLLIPLPESSR